MRSQNKELNLKCDFCHKPLRLYNAYFEIYDRDKLGKLTYPGGGDSREQIVLFTHSTCGPDTGYAFSFTRLGEDWGAHLRGKVWWFPAIQDALEEARQVTQIVQTEFFKVSRRVEAEGISDADKRRLE